MGFTTSLIQAYLYMLSHMTMAVSTKVANVVIAI